MFFFALESRQLNITDFLKQTFVPLTVKTYFDS